MENELKVIDKRGQFDETPNLPAQASPNAVIIMAMQKGYTPELIEKMMSLQERNDANEARKAYHRAMAAFAENPPDIEKDKKVSYTTSKGTTAYSHAQLGTSTAKIQSALSPHGLHASWRTIQTDKSIKVVCRITHELGHFEETDLSAGADDSGSKNSIQAIGSTISYLERYTLFALTGLASKDMDDDGKGADPPEYVSPGQLSTIVDMINEKNVDEDPFLSYMKAESAETILAKDYNKAITALKKAKGRTRQPGEEG